jgi:2-polyprenyl-3-methyl-5-hydroxy-6-metoxy-1,4-benzoquinol methylase
MDGSLFGRREKVTINLQGLEQDIEVARNKFRQQDYLAAMDLYEQFSDAYPSQSVNILAELYDLRQTIRSEDRYTLYQSRCCEFGIKEGDKVLDIGSGHAPFPYATHLSDIAITDNYYGRTGKPFKHIEGKPVYEFNVENIPFEDNEFDFIYCSHVLEHSESPERACQELMRVGKRGYIETPTKAKDLWLNCAKVSNHRWSVEIENDALVFDEYTPEQIEGLACNILLSMHCSPQTKREKAFSVIIYLKPEFFNTMLLWDGEFEYRVKREASSGLVADGNPVRF